LTSTTHDYNELQTQPNGGFNNENRTPKNQGWGKIMYLDSSGAAAAVEEGNSADEEVEESRDKGFLRGEGVAAFLFCFAAAARPPAFDFRRARGTALASHNLS
jgi:hypothetical protein